MSTVKMVTGYMGDFDFGSLRKHDMRILEGFTSDAKLLFDLDIQNCFCEIEDIYSTQPSYAENASMVQTKKTVLIAYRIYLDGLIANANPTNEAQYLEILSKLLSAATYCMVNNQDKEKGFVSGQKNYQFYETRWEPDEIICFLLTYLPCCNDDAKRELAVLNYPPTLHSIIWKAYCILKDSIALSECTVAEDFLQCGRTLQYPASYNYLDFAQSIGRNI